MHLFFKNLLNSIVLISEPNRKFVIIMSKWVGEMSYSFDQFLPEDWNDFIIEAFTGVAST